MAAFLSSMYAEVKTEQFPQDSSIAYLLMMFYLLVVLNRSSILPPPLNDVQLTLKTGFAY